MCASLGTIQQRVHRLVNARFPAASQIDVFSLKEIVRLLDD
jgi:hypothetical protein